MADTWTRIRRGKRKENNRFTKSDALAARRVLRDVYRTRNELSQALATGNLAQIRLRWITAVTLLRAVGHLLKKFDASRSPALAKSIDAAWKRWEEFPLHHLIFHEFIKKKRDIVLKEYRSSIFPPSSETRSTKRTCFYETILIGDTTYSPEGAIGASIKWWENELRRIELDAAC